MNGRFAIATGTKGETRKERNKEDEEFFAPAAS
jgi:hypothetical protein